MNPFFARRTGWNLATNRYTSALEAHRRAGREVLDLTASNPTTVGLKYREEDLLQSLTRREALTYEPRAKGLPVAREAIASYYAEYETTVTPDDLILTTSTSEGYSFVFRLLCDPGDAVLVPSPSYPLFDFLADLQDVKLSPYELIYDHGWQIDLHSLQIAIEKARAQDTTCRAVLVVHPNNPTGSYVKPQEAEELNRLCAANQMAIIADEVFLDYRLDPACEAFSFAGSPVGRAVIGDERVERLLTGSDLAVPAFKPACTDSNNPPAASAPRETNEAPGGLTSAAADRNRPAREPESSLYPKPSHPGLSSAYPRPLGSARLPAPDNETLTFALSGLSKISALPQMKVAWIAVSGPEPLKHEALARLEVIADTYLSMNAPVQWAVPAMLDERRNVQPQMLSRIRENLAELDAQLARQTLCHRLAVEGGWYAVLRVPVTGSDEEFAIALLERTGVLVHPGHFYDFGSEGYVVISLITPGEDFANGIARLLDFVSGT